MRMRNWKSWLSILAGISLLFSCAGKQVVVDAQLCAGVFPITLEVAALCSWTNHEEKTCKNLDQWTEFLSAMPERPDPRDPTKKLPAKGPAIAMSSEHMEKILALVDALCYKYKACTFEQTQMLEGFKKNMKELGKPQVNNDEFLCPY